MENKSEGNERKLILGDFNYTVDKMDKDNDGNKTQRLYWYVSNAPSKFVMDKELEHLWRRENPGFSEFTHYNSSYGTRLITKWCHLLTVIMLFLLTYFPRKLKLGKFNGTLIILFYVSPSFPSFSK